MGRYCRCECTGSVERDSAGHGSGAGWWEFWMIAGWILKRSCLRFATAFGGSVRGVAVLRRFLQCEDIGFDFE